MSSDVDPRGNITIRYATGDNAAMLIELGTSTFADTFAEVNTKEDMDLYLQKNFNMAQMAAELEDNKNTFLIAECDGIPAGYAKLRKGTTPPELVNTRAIELERLYAAKAYIGKHVGKQLMDQCVAISRKQGYDTLWLGVWEHNPRAIAFYRKCGFEKFSEHPFLLGTDVQTDHMMKKDLRKIV